jgi:hypothetical protein
MHGARTNNAVLRVTFALVFGFMSLGHWPVMAFAKASAAVQDHATTPAPAVHAHHHAGAADPDCEPADAAAHHHGAPDRPGICNATGCFLVIAPPAIVAPQSNSSLLAQLGPAPARAIVAVLPDPADRPPRLQA